MQRRFRVDEYFYFQANFEREGGDGRYPPPTLHALLISYLIKTDDKNINLKHRLIQYIFLDMASCLSKKEDIYLIHHYSTLRLFAARSNICIASCCKYCNINPIS